MFYISIISYLTMSLFNNPDLLTNRSFSWALGPYTAQPEDLTEFPPDVSKLSIFVSDDGTINADEQLYLFKKTDPIDSAIEQTYSDSNLFIAGLKKAIGPFPIYGIMLFPTTLPDSKELIDAGGAFGVITQGGQNTKFPTTTPDGFVPCAGQVLRYPGGGIVVVPDLTSTTSEPSDGGPSITTYYAPPGMAYMMKVPEGYEKMEPELSGMDLADFGTPGPVTLA